MVGSLADQVHTTKSTEESFKVWTLTIALSCDVAYDIAPDLSVGHDQGLVIDGEDAGRDQIHVVHPAGQSDEQDCEKWL